MKLPDDAPPVRLPGPFIRIAWALLVLAAISIFGNAVPSTGGYRLAYLAAVSGAIVTLAATVWHLALGPSGHSHPIVSRIALFAFIVSLIGGLVVVILAPIAALGEL